MSDAENTLLAPSFLKRLEKLEIASRRLIRGTRAGSKRSRMLGQSLEFADYRSYTAGDDIRQVDWYAYARLGKWFLKVFLDERELTLSLYIDCSRSMAFGHPSKARRACEMAAALGYIGLHHADRVGVVTFDRRIRHVLPPQQGRRHVHTLLSSLEKITFTERGDMAEALRQPGSLPARPGMAVVLTDGWFEGGYEEPLRRLAASKQQVTVVHLTTAEERDPAYQGDLRLIDSESEATKDVTLSPAVLRKYRETFTAFSREWRGWCFHRGIGYISVSAEEPLERIVFTVFRQMGLVR